MAKEPRVNSESAKEIQKAQEQFDNFYEDLNKQTLDVARNAPLQDVEPQTKIAQSDLEKTKEIYLKPKRSISSREKFNERFREDYNYKKEYVKFTAENKEVIGENIDMWTKPFPGVPAEEWLVPVNKPVWAPRYVAEQIKSCRYSEWKMTNTQTGNDGTASYYGSMVVETQKPRLDAIPYSNRKSIFMGEKF